MKKLINMNKLYLKGKEKHWRIRLNYRQKLKKWINLKKIKRNLRLLKH